MRHEKTARLLEVSDLAKSLGGKRVVDGVDLHCHGGEVVGLLFTATLPSIDHMGLPFFLVIRPAGRCA